MSENRPPAGRYRVSTRLLARKGAAEPILRNEARLELVSDVGKDPSDDNRLRQALLHATADQLATEPRHRNKKAAAPLTALFDPALVGVVSRQSGQLARVTEAQNGPESAEQQAKKPPSPSPVKRTLGRAFKKLSGRSRT